MKLLPRVASALCVAIAVLTLNAACGGNDAPGVALPLLPSTSVVVSPPSARTAAERDASAAFTGMVAAWVKAGRTADTEEPDLGRYAQGLAYTSLVSRMLAAQSEGKVVRGEPKVDQRVTGASPSDDPSSLELAVCLDDSDWLEYRRSNGKPWDDVPGGRHAMTAVVKRTGGVWKVDSFSLDKAGTC
jgi:hypothetical protein